MATSNSTSSLPPPSESTTSPTSASARRPSPGQRSFTAPDKMANGHFASPGQNGTANFEHGVQVIDEDKEFKYVACLRLD